jgi:hypothetical protein
VEYGNRYLRLPKAGSDYATVVPLMLLLAGNIAWAVVAGCIVASDCGWIVGGLTVAILAAGFNLRWENVFTDGGWFSVEFAIGVLSSMILASLWYTNELNGRSLLASVLGWFVIGCFNVRFQTKFWGPPVVFESREFTHAIGFLSGPVYWCVWAAGAILVVICEKVAKVINAREAHRQMRDGLVGVRKNPQ